MRQVVLVVAIFAGSVGGVRAQSSAPAERHWIFLVDKNPGDGRSLSAEPGWVTPAAEARRAARGINVGPAFDAPVSPAYLDSLRALGVEPRVVSRWLNAVSASLTTEQRALLEARSFVRDVRPVAGMAPSVAMAPAPVVVAPSLQDVRAGYRLDYGASAGQLELVNAVPVLEEGLKGAGVKLGIIDTGMGDLVDIHPSTAVMVADGRFMASQDFTGQPVDASRHGFSVLSVAAGYDPGQLIGPAYGATVYHARTEYAPTETNQEEDNFVAGLEWMEAQGVDVVNISLGYSLFDAGQTSYTTGDLDGDTGITTIAADLAVERGMVVVAAAGNEGCGAPTSCWYYVSTPADGHNVLAVGAVNATGQVTSFSSRGPTADGRTKPDVSAQGGSVFLGTGAGYASSNGTSFASPMVAGVVALLLEANPALTPGQVAEILKATASQSGSPDQSLGWGIIDATAAVGAARDRVATQVERSAEAPRFALDAPFPHPVIGTTMIGITLHGGPQAVRLTVYNSIGQRVDVAFDGVLASGKHRVEIDFNELPAGLYLYRLEASSGIASGRIIRL